MKTKLLYSFLLIILLSPNLFSQFTNKKPTPPSEKQGWAIQYDSEKRFYIGGGVDSRLTYFDLVFGYGWNDTKHVLINAELGVNLIRIGNGVICAGVAGECGYNYEPTKLHDWFFIAPQITVGGKLHLNDNYTIHILYSQEFYTERFFHGIKTGGEVLSTNKLIFKLYIF